MNTIAAPSATNAEIAARVVSEVWAARGCGTGLILVARREGVAFGIETNTIGMCTVAAPIFDSSGKVAASMAVIAPTERFGPVEMRDYRTAVLTEATLVSRELGAPETVPAPFR